MVTAAARVGLAEGLECVTLRRVADELGVRPGSSATTSPRPTDSSPRPSPAPPWRSSTVCCRSCPPARPRLRPRRCGARAAAALLAHLERRLRRRQQALAQRPAPGALPARPPRARRRAGPALVPAYRAGGRHRGDGGDFRCADPWASAVRIHVAIDGTSAYVNTGVGHRAAPIADMARTLAEAELGLASGALGPR
ncbi:hypothetical protein ACR6C2_26655 [Streptomyces sp. INA 01156]